MNDPAWELYLRAPWWWQLFIPLLLLLHAAMILYNDLFGEVYILGS